MSTNRVFHLFVGKVCVRDPASARRSLPVSGLWRWGFHELGALAFGVHRPVKVGGRWLRCQPGREGRPQSLSSATAIFRQ
ncbi:MAG: hypothetical protein WCS99_21550, partial [Limisphaerales bacterium]